MQPPCSLNTSLLSSPNPPAVVEDQNALTNEVFEQCETRDRFKALFTDLYK